MGKDLNDLGGGLGLAFGATSTLVDKHREGATDVTSGEDDDPDDGAAGALVPAT